jgi:hypothetical protein
MIAGTLAFSLFYLPVNIVNPVSGQELLPEVGSNESIGEPNTNVTTTDNNEDLPEAPNSILDPFFGR